MPYTLPEDWTHEHLIDHSIDIYAGLIAIKAPDLAAPWETHETLLHTARDARDQDRRALRVASAVVRATDGLWDEAVTDLSGRTFLESGKDASAPPYSLVFLVAAADLVHLGPARATAEGTSIVVRARQVNHPALIASVDAFAAINDELAQAAGVRTSAERTAALHSIKRLELIDATELLSTQTEIELLKRYPRRKSLIRAILAPQRSSAKGKKSASTPEPPQGTGLLAAPPA